MRAARAVLRNAANIAGPIHDARKETVGVWTVDYESNLTALSSSCGDVPAITTFWQQKHFWVPEHRACGFPCIFVATDEEADGWQEKLDKLGVIVRVCALEPGDSVFECVTVVVHPKMRGATYVGRAEFNNDLANWIADPWPIGCAHSDAYAKYIHFPLSRTEDVWGKLGADPWHDARVMLADIKRHGELDKKTWDAFWHLLDKGKVSEAVRVGDLGVPLEAAAGEWRAEEYERRDFMDPHIINKGVKMRPIRKMSKPMWTRELRHKRRHYFDIASLYKVCMEQHTAGGHGNLFRELARETLAQVVCAEQPYERMYLTLFWIWTSPYMFDIADFMLASGLLYATLDQWRATLKEITATVTQSWFFPLTNVQHISAAYFLNAEDLSGYPDANPDAGAITLEILEYATDNFEGYTFPDGKGGRSTAAYLEQYEHAIRSFLEPMYQQHADTAQTFEQLLATRVAWGPGGVAGRRAREVFGPEQAPANSAKGYVFAKTKAEPWRRDWGTTYVEACDKSDERGATRTISATDMRDQLAETVVYKPIHNRFTEVGCDIGESPNQAMERHLRLATASKNDDEYMHDGKTLVCWDWQAFDHYMMQAERAINISVMRRLTEEYVKGQARDDILRELEHLEHGVDELIYRSQAFADERYRGAVDAIIAKSEGRACRLDGHAGNSAVRVFKPSGQQSGRQSTLNSNTMVGQARLLVRDAEIMGKTAHLQHRTSVYKCNRADDVNEVFARYAAAVASSKTMLDQRHRANKKKQVTQFRSSVYLRTLYAGGSARAFPARAIYAAATGSPDKGAGSESAYFEKLSSVARGLDMWVRRGGSMTMARRLYDDAFGFFSKTRIWLPKRSRSGRRILTTRARRDVVEAPVMHGGLGILPPGVYEYDFRYKCSPIEKYARVAKAWAQDLQHYVSRLARTAPGIVDLEVAASARFEADTNFALGGDHRRNFRGRWAKARVHQGGDGQTRFAERQRAVAASLKHVHVDNADDVPFTQYVGRALIECGQAFDRAYRRAEADVTDQHIKLELDSCRGPPGYGLLDHEWHGYAAVVMQEISGAQERVEMARLTANSTVSGRAFWDNSAAWPDHARVRYLLGDMASCSAWDKIVPPSWSGWLVNTLHYCLDYAFNNWQGKFNSRYAVTRLSAWISSRAGRMFVTRYPELCLH